MTLFLAILSVVALVIAYNVRKDRKAVAAAREALERRRKALLTKYRGNGEIVDAIMRQRIWMGQTHDQVIDSLGHPAGIEEKVMKAKVRHILKYGAKGRSHALKITLENGRVVGWDAK